MSISFWQAVFPYFIVLICPLVNGFASVTRDPCPAYVRPGEKWFLESSCIMCQCQNQGQGYSCYGCSMVAYQLENPQCYYELVDPAANYPGCCERHMLCPGDPQYDEQHVIG